MGFRRRRWRDVRPEEDRVRVNNAIRVPEVRVVNDDGQQLGVMSTDAARDVASRVGLDLVEISPTARPPVCKIMDYGRYKYELKKKASSAKKTQHQSQVKEIKFRPQISKHDLDFKLKKGRQFLFDGDKVKCTVQFRGREIVHKELGRDLLTRIIEQLKEIANAESYPQMEGRMLSQTVAPNRAVIDKIKADEERKAREEGRDLEAEAAAAAAEVTLDDPDDPDDSEDMEEAADGVASSSEPEEQKATGADDAAESPS